MSLQGINAYTSNMMYGSLFGNNGKTQQSGSSTMDLLQNLNRVDKNTDLRELMEKVDLTRTTGWKKSMMEEYRKVFKGETVDNSAAKKNEMSLSHAAKKLSDSVKELATANSAFYGDNVGIQHKIQEFVSSYNETVDGLKNTESMSALRSGVSMASTTAAFSKSLSGIGISVGADNKLSINEDKLAKASASDVKSVFSGQYSYGSKIADKAGAIDRNAQIQANTLYNNKGQQNQFNFGAISALFSKSF